MSDRMGNRRIMSAMSVITAICALASVAFAVASYSILSNVRRGGEDGVLHVLLVRATDHQTGRNHRPFIDIRMQATPKGFTSLNTPEFNTHWAADSEAEFMVWRPRGVQDLIMNVPGYCARQFKAGAVVEEIFEFPLEKCPGDTCTNDACQYMRALNKWMNEVGTGQLKVLEDAPDSGKQ